jgi:hypothetical protein
MIALFEWFFDEQDVNPFESPRAVAPSESVELKRLDREEMQRTIGRLF